MPTLPFLFQLTDIRRVERMGGRALICWDPGLGKTLSSLLYLHRNPDALPAVVICPAPLKLQWQREASHHFGFRSEVLSGIKPRPFGADRPPILIANYEILRPGSHGPGWVDVLREINPNTIILDEAQALKSSRTSQSRQVKRLCKGVRHILALTATPIEIRPMEIWQTLHILAPKAYPNQWAFGHKFCGPKRTYWGWTFNGSTDPEKLHKLLTEGDSNGTPPLLIRRRKADVIKQLPSKIRTVVPLEIDDRTDYDKASNDFLAWLAGREPGRLKGAIRSQGLARAGTLKRLAAELKLSAAGRWIDNWLLGGHGKIILFAHHKSVVSWLRDRYRGRCVVVDGSVTGKRRQGAVDQFQRDRRTDILIGSKAAYKGLNLTAAVASAFLEYSWNPADHLQAEDRNYARLSDVHGSSVYYLVMPDTIEDKIARLLQERKKVASRILDGGVGSGDKLDLFDLLMREIRKEIWK